MALTTTAHLPATLEDSFSFYLPATDARLVRACAELADAVVVKGPGGPKLVTAMSATGWTATVLFDRANYERGATPVEPDRWFEAQANAGADRLLTAGAWIPWDRSGEILLRAVEQEQRAASRAPGCTMLLALDCRWLRAGLYSTIAALEGLDQPVALVLAHRGDPLGSSDAVNGLLALTRTISGLTVLRCDHGGIGAVAFGASHASMGLRTVYRHFVPPHVEARGIPNDRTARLFAWELMDWFSASRIAGWAAMEWTTSCALTCCGGQTLDRFLDDRLAADAGLHNRTVLAHLANYVLGAPVTDRRRLFGRLCSDAVARYGPMGKLSEIIEPKAQLLQWAQFA